MLIEEAIWFGKRIKEIDPRGIFPMLDVGSSTESYRKNFQPWIDHYIFKPAREKGQTVLHLDILDAPGVDLVGDLRDPNFLQELSEMEFKSIMCCNLLEVVPNKKEICAALASIIPAGGIFFISCPYLYPYHPEPIDTMFRPDVDELARLFPNTSIVFGEKVMCGTYWDYVVQKKYVPFVKPRTIRGTLLHIPWILKNFQATCLVLRKY